MAWKSHFWDGNIGVTLSWKKMEQERYRRKYQTSAFLQVYIIVVDLQSCVNFFCDSVMLLLFSLPVMSDSLWPHGLQHTRPPCPSLSPRVCPSSVSLHRWCHPAISSSDALFFCPQSFPVSGTFPMSHLFTSDDPNTGASASGSVLPMNIQDWCPLRLTGLISLLSKGLSEVFSSTTIEGINSLAFCLLYSPALTTIRDHW